MRVQIVGACKSGPGILDSNFKMTRFWIQILNWTRFWMTPSDSEVCLDSKIKMMGFRIQIWAYRALIVMLIIKPYIIDSINLHCKK